MIADWRKPHVTKETPAMVLSKAKLANGATFTRLKSGVAEGAETVEGWKQAGPRLKHLPMSYQ